MGRIKTTLMKRVTIKLLNEHRDKFKNTFEENKEIVGQLLDVKSKKFRNVIAGYVTRLMLTKKQRLT